MTFQTAAVVVLSLVLGSAEAFSPTTSLTSHGRCAPALSATVVKTSDADLKLEQSIGLLLPDEAEEEEEPATASLELSRIQPGRYKDKVYSIAIPMLKRPPKLDGSHAGDYGFDPLGFTEQFDLYTMQEAEIRHARLAMLAVVGWPMSELLAPDWLLQENGCAPSVLNGFNLVTLPATLVILTAIGFLEYQTALRGTTETSMGKLHHNDMADVWKWGVAGDYNFDPLNLYNKVIGNDAYSRKGLREVEIAHGRSAMLGITSFAIWEALTGHAIVENSMFFHPNLLLPALTMAYFAFQSVFELQESDTFIQFKISSEGAARLENVRLSMPDLLKRGPDAETTEQVISSVSNQAEKVQKYLQNNGIETPKTDNLFPDMTELAGKVQDYLKKNNPL